VVGSKNSSWRNRYGSVVTPAIKLAVLEEFSIFFLINAYRKDSSFLSTIPTRLWKRVGKKITYLKLIKRKPAPDRDIPLSLVGELVAREAALQIVEQILKRQNEGEQQDDR
jgi:hypothetical protein